MSPDGHEVTVAAPPNVVNLQTCLQPARFAVPSVEGAVIERSRHFGRAGEPDTNCFGLGRFPTLEARRSTADACQTCAHISLVGEGGLRAGRRGEPCAMAYE